MIQNTFCLLFKKKGGLETDHLFLSCFDLGCMVLLMLPEASSQVETVQVHDFVPGGHEIPDEFFPAIFTGVNLSNGPEL